MSGAQLEVCAESLRACLAAEEGGAHRVELCADLSVGGLTPGTDLMRTVRARCALPIVAMIRPRAGDFRHGPEELALMERDVDRARELGMDGVVLGVLDAGDRVDRRAVARLVARAGELPVTFHRAFDRTPDAARALDLLIELGVSRVLTSGHAPTALEGAEELAELVARAGGRIGVMPGGNVRAENAAELRRRTGARELHSSVGGDAAISAGAVRTLVARLQGV